MRTLLNGLLWLPAVATAISGSAFLLSWLYIPVFMLILRRRAPRLYSGLGGFPFVNSQLNLMMFFMRRRYLSSIDPVVIRHGAILRVTLCGGFFLTWFAGIVALCWLGLLDHLGLLLPPWDCMGRTQVECARG